MRFIELYEQHKKKRLTCEEAALILGVHEKTFRRWEERYELYGVDGLNDKRLEKAANNAASTNEVIEMLNLFETRYRDFTVAHFYDKWKSEHEGQRCYTWVKNRLQEAGFIKKAKKRGAHHRKRERKALEGMMLHQDGSTHEWIEGIICDLIVTMDDATSEIYSAFFVEEEGTWSSFQGIKEVIVAKGLFCSLYTDRGTHYWTTLKAGGEVDKDHLTEFGRAMQQLGIEMIAAYSPEARGRSERMFQTLQGRLPKELKLAKITDINAANRFLKETFIPAFNQRFSSKAAEEGSAFVPWLGANNNIDEILCIQEKRTVNKDNTVQYKNKCLQIPKTTHRCHYIKVAVKVHEYHDGSMSIFHGPRCLARYQANGELINEALVSHPCASLQSASS